MQVQLLQSSTEVLGLLLHRTSFEVLKIYYVNMNFSMKLSSIVRDRKKTTIIY